MNHNPRSVEVTERNDDEAWDEWQRLSSRMPLDDTDWSRSDFEHAARRDEAVERRAANRALGRERWLRQSAYLAVALVAACAAFVIALHHKPF